MVYRQKSAKYSLIIFLILLLIILVISAFIRIPFRMKTYAEVFPKEKWLLTRGGNGELVSNVLDFTEGHTAEYNIAQFERGEFVSANFSNFLKNGKKEFTKGDTVVYMKSSYVQDQMVAAEGALEVALANLKSQSSAQKEPLIHEAENKLKLTEEKLKEQKVLFDRAKQLFDKGFSSQQEYELQKWTLDLLEIESKVYSAQLENLKTGVKPEEIKLLESQAGSIRSRLKFLKERQSQLLLQAPISGRIISSFSPDTLLYVCNSRQVVLHMPVKLIDLPEFKEGQRLPIEFTDMKNAYVGKIISISREVKFLERQQVVFISILLDNSSNQLLPGMVLESSIELRKVNLLEHLIKLITS